MAGPLLTGATLWLAAATLTAQPQGAAAQQRGTVADAGCHDAVERRLAEWGAGAERYRDPVGPFGTRQWRMPTREIGAWVLVQEAETAAPSLARVDARSTTRVNFDMQCREQSASVATHSAAPPSAGAFTDDDVRA